MNTYITSDLHFRHPNILRFCKDTRSKFCAKDEHFEYMKNDLSLIRFTANGLDYMENKLIEEWNNKISNDDIIYHLGDFCFGGVINAIEILRQLNGIKRLIIGNHDYKLVKYINENDLMDELNIEWMKDFYSFYYKDNNIRRRVVMCHYPMHTWDGKCHKSSVNLYGHLHDKSANIEGSLNVGYDYLGEIVELSYAINLAYSTYKGN